MRQSTEQLAAAVPATRWIACSAGHGAEGRRLYDWTRVELATPAIAGMARWLRVRCSRSDGELAFYACYAPAGTRLSGWSRWPAWYRPITLALLAHAFLAVTRARASGPEWAKGDTAA